MKIGISAEIRANDGCAVATLETLKRYVAQEQHVSVRFLGASTGDTDNAYAAADAELVGAICQFSVQVVTKVRTLAAAVTTAVPPPRRASHRPASRVRRFGPAQHRQIGGLERHDG